MFSTRQLVLQSSYHVLNLFALVHHLPAQGAEGGLACHGVRAVSSCVLGIFGEALIGGVIK